jgi:peptidoglycan/xylan/chitin deacetylase (PgdA/CDA1 family)
MEPYINAFLYLISQKWMIHLFRKRSILPYYHLISDQYLPHISELYPYKNVKQFEEDLDFYQKYYSEITPDELLNKNINSNKFLISFDDGFQEIYTIVYPILKRREIKAVFFINPNFVDNNEGFYKSYISLIISKLKAPTIDLDLFYKISNILNIEFISKDQIFTALKRITYSKRHKLDEVLNLLGISKEEFLQSKPYISKKQIQEMIDDGFYFGGHTMNHAPLWQLTLEEQKKEIIDSVEWLKTNFNIKYSYFAFPFTDEKISVNLLKELFDYDSNLIVFGISEFKKDIDERIIHRIATEHPKRKIAKEIVSRNLFHIYNLITNNSKIKRQ